MCFVFGVVFTTIGYYMGITIGKEQGHNPRDDEGEM
jgi:hypothetical protein